MLADLVTEFTMGGICIPTMLQWCSVRCPSMLVTCALSLVAGSDSCWIAAGVALLVQDSGLSATSLQGLPFILGLKSYTIPLQALNTPRWRSEPHRSLP